MNGQYMIAKERDSFAPTTDVLAKAGRAAEEQVAFYLRRAFVKEETLRIFNGIRLENNGDTAQIDHLSLHPWGFVIIESKSVRSRVRVNDHGEWMRSFNDSWHGMPSPILQARRQGDFLHRYLQEHTDILRDKTLFRRRDFTNVMVDIVVAISDGGIVHRPRQLRIDEVCKADQIVDQIRAILLRYHTKPRIFSASELERVCQFLLSHHRPHVYPGSSVSDSTVRMYPSQLVSTIRVPTAGKPYACRHCRSIALSVLHGRYGYYYKCKQCNGNTHIDNTCPQCHDRETIRQNGQYYLADCRRCATSTAFYPQVPGDEAEASQQAIRANG